MADLGEAFDVYKSYKSSFLCIDYFFTQRNLTEDREYIDKNMNRQVKKVKITNNLLALNIPNANKTKASDLFEIEIYGDEGHYYKGIMHSYDGIIPGIIISIKGDKKFFIHITHKYNINNVDNSKNYINFIEVPKRFQYIDERVDQDEEPI